jgi:hypothetical protein
MWDRRLPSIFNMHAVWALGKMKLHFTGVVKSDLARPLPQSFSSKIYAYGTCKE